MNARMPSWVAGLPAENALRRAEIEARRLELFPRLVDALESVLAADDAEEPLTNTEVAFIRNVVMHAKAIGPVRAVAPAVPWFLQEQAL